MYAREALAVRRLEEQAATSCDAVLLVSQAEEDLIAKQGQKRGTRYVWKGITNQTVHAAPILVKRAEEKSPEEKAEEARREEILVQEILRTYAQPAEPEPVDEE